MRSKASLKAFSIGELKRCFVLFSTDLTHVSNGLTDIDGNQLTTPEFTVTETGYFLSLKLSVSTNNKNALWLSIYIVNELSHRMPSRLYSKNLDEIRDSPTWVGCCLNEFLSMCLPKKAKSTNLTA